MKMIKHIAVALTLAGTFCACTEDEVFSPQLNDRQEMKLQAVIEQIHTSRVNDNGFADGDAIGVYIVDFKNNQPGELGVAGNNTDNMKFTYHEEENKWKGTGPIYWKDGKTPVDAYGYYPYDDEVSSVDAYPFEIKNNQPATIGNKSITGYEMSDFLWAKSSSVVPTTALINLRHKHIMANVTVALVMGDGFNQAEWNKLEKVVMVENTVRQTTINLATGSVSIVPKAKPSAIVACASGTDFRAVVAPQTVAAGQPLLSVTLDGETYKYKREMATTYVPGKCHKYTLQVNKRLPSGDFDFKLISESITPWETDPQSHNGAVKEYVVIHIPQPGHLKEIVRTKGIDPLVIKNLKLTGHMDDGDFKMLREQMPYLEALNIKEVKLHNSCYDHTGVHEDDVIPYEACFAMKTLKYVVFPDRLKKIGVAAFRHTILTGSLILPEGLTHVGDAAFSNWQAGAVDVSSNLTGELRLPSTLEFIGGQAFRNCAFTGELRLPEGLKEIGGEAFDECENFTGQLVLPKGLQKLGRAFGGVNGMSGQLVIPEAIDNPGGFGSHFTSVKFPSKMTRITGFQAVLGLEGDVYLPETVREIGDQTFMGNAIRHINLPEALERLDKGSFNFCDLRDTVKVPSQITVLPESVFANNKKLDAVVLPAGLMEIQPLAFENCFSLSYIRCLSKEPPVIKDLNAFNGIAKNNFTIEVPEGSVDAYRNAPIWSEFKRIATYRNFVVRPTRSKVLNKGEVRKIILNADSYWSVKECPSWCHLDKTSGYKKTELTLTIDPMAHGNPNRKAKIIFEMTQPEVRTTHMTIEQYDYQYDEDESIELKNATKGNGVNIFIVGDGYDAQDIAEGLYLKDMYQELEYFFDVEPYATYKEYFNVYTSFAMSHESGIGTLNTLRDVKFGTSYGDFSTGSRIMGDHGQIMRYAVETVPEIDVREASTRLLTIVVPNAPYYDGQTVLYDTGGAVAFCPKSELPYPNDARGLIQHEACGHGFGKLGDEYIYHLTYIQRCPCICCAHVPQFLESKNLGWYDNLSLDGKYRTNEWHQLIFDPQFSDKVDIFEGGYFHAWGIYRPEWNSCMNNNVPYFNAPSRMSIVKRIMNYAGEEFTFEKFKALDKDNMGKDFTDTRSAIEKGEGAIPLHAPIIVKGAPNFN